MTWAYVTPKNDVVFFDELEIKGSARDIVSVIKHADGGVCPAATTYLFWWTEEEISPHDSRVKR
jgi:hypothetical protein